MDRRAFLKAAGIGGGLLMGGGALYAVMHDADPLADHKAATQAVLTERYGASSTKRLMACVLAECEVLQRRAPDIGGEANMFTQWLTYGVYYLALYRVLAANGASLEAGGAVIYDVFQAQADYPAWLMRAVGRLEYSRAYQKRLHAAVEATQRRRYDGDWVASWVEGDGTTFDYGTDIHECGICKLYAAEGVPELAPYLCLSDEVGSRATGRGLVRHMTVAEGFPLCDFRYKWGRETYVAPLRDGWPPQFGRADAGGCRAFI
ncbi:MAG: L-2-amino-thiazoline-4-carboxylic acid hydrolase [Anaerolineae bacterium]|nr:L-2-amino-thiazoline-4-carboxylic acid hydrolase [Anaerolineae bacterium]